MWGFLKGLARFVLLSAVFYGWLRLWAWVSVPYAFPPGTPLTDNSAFRMVEWGFMLSVLPIFFAARWLLLKLIPPSDPIKL